MKFERVFTALTVSAEAAIMLSIVALVVKFFFGG